MPTIRLVDSYSRSARKFTKNNLKRAATVKKALRLFQGNPKHPSLHIEKLSGRKIWTIRIDRGNRLFFTWSDKKDTAIFFFVGPHDSYRIIKK